MHTGSLLSLFGIVSLTFASDLSLLPRQAGYTQEPCSASGPSKECGNICIPINYVCCPDGSGGCPPTTYCEILSNAKYGCCAIGERCVGDGGVMSLPYFGPPTETFDWFPTEFPTATVGAPSESRVPPAMTTTDPSPTPCSQQPGMKACGGAFECIPEGNTCCPDGSGSCSSGEYCMLDISGKYACCPNGQQCSGSNDIASGLSSHSPITSSATSTSASTFSLPTSSAASGDASGPLAVSEMAILSSFLVGLFPGFLG